MVACGVFTRRSPCGVTHFPGVQVHPAPCGPGQVGRTSGEGTELVRGTDPMGDGWATSLRRESYTLYLN